MSHPSFAIAAGHPSTLEAAAHILRDGGNAIDAAVAAYWAAVTAEPCMASAGAGGFALVHPAGQKPVLVDFFCHTPQNPADPAVDLRAKEVDFGDTQETFYIGSGSMAVPGAVAGMFALQKRFGTRSMAVLAEPGIELARQGVALTPFQALDMRLLQEFLGDTDYGKSLFFQDGRVKQEGDVVRFSGWADYLDYLSRHDARAFYQDEPARHILRDHGGHFTEKDLEEYEVVLRKPLEIHFLDHVVWTNPWPAAGGLVLGNLLTEMSGWPKGTLNDSYRLTIAWDELCRRVQSIGFHADTLYEALWGRPAPADRPDPRHGSTSHISVVDDQGNAISMTFSIGEGSGYLIPGTDIHMNNMLGELALLPEGLRSWTPDRRLSSMMAPTLLASQDLQEWAALGTGGAGRIPFMLAQVIGFMVGQKQHVIPAIRHPRMHRDTTSMHLEPGWPEVCYGDHYSLPVRSWKAPSLFFGGVHAVLKNGPFLEACGDFRREGVGFVG